MLVRPTVRDYRTWIIDSRRWNAYRPRTDDIVIATRLKCGTTWMQRIVDQLVFQSAEPRPVMQLAPWIDRRFPEPVEAVMSRLEIQEHRRFLKRTCSLTAYRSMARSSTCSSRETVATPACPTTITVPPLPARRWISSIGLVWRTRRWRGSIRASGPTRRLLSLVAHQGCASRRRGRLTFDVISSALSRKLTLPAMVSDIPSWLQGSPADKGRRGNLREVSSAGN